jgi:hypothetical protein
MMHVQTSARSSKKNVARCRAVGPASAIYRSAVSAHEPAVEQQKIAFSLSHLMMKNSGATNPLIPDNVGLCPE